jgi:tetratricopeptide (TPR) repeat protein
MAHASPPVPASYHAIVERLCEAMRVRTRNLRLARDIIRDELKSSDAPSSVFAYWDNHVMAYEEPLRSDEALQAILSIAEGPVEDIDTHAKAIVRASQLAVLIGAIAELKRVKAIADRFFAIYAYPTFKALCEFTTGRAFMLMERLDEAITTMREMAMCDTASGYSGYNRSARAHIGLCYARLGDLGEAKRWLALAEEGDDPTVECWTKFLRGTIALFEGRSNDARAPLYEAYQLAKEKNETLTMGDILLYRCHAYKTLGNVDAFWAVYDQARDLSINGSPYLRDALEGVKRGVPNIE